jgi:malate permease and related proteins
MQLAQLVLNQVAIMLVLIFCGYFAVKKGYLSKQGSKDLGNILLYIITPAVIIQAFRMEYSDERTFNLLISAGLAFIAILISIIVAHIFYRKNGVLNFGVSFSNAVFMGIPLIYNTLGSDAVFYALAFVIFTAIGQWTYGIMVITHDKSVISVKKIIKNPIIYYVLMGMFLYFTQLKLPVILTQTIAYLVPLNTPVPMFMIGGFIAGLPFKSIFNQFYIYIASLVRLILVPIIVMFILKLIPSVSKDFETMKMAILLVASTPVGANVAIFAQQFNQDVKESAQVVSLSTLLSVITIPLIILLNSFI